mmetsp:Transcript_1353/g.2573  ORF Transcript_1353/g.2573 Transcript_1353/m.2573 type:complete len:113 (+) Transcript_1353:75-413(+)
MTTDVSEVVKLSPYAKEGIPTSGTQCLSIAGHSEARHTVIVAIQLLGFTSICNVPYLHVVVIVTGEKELSCAREIYRGDAAEFRSIMIFLKLAAASEVKQSRPGVVRTSTEG